jgi:ABC-type Fe3+-hydroxamate transport system substrate-binding protein
VSATDWNVDAMGAAHPVCTGAPRIVSLVPSVTELVCDLGLASALVGRTGFCIHPRETLRGVRKVGGTKDVDLSAVRELAPSHVIVNVDENLRETAEALSEFVPSVVVTHPLGPLDNPPLYRLLGAIFDRAEAAEALCRRFEAALASARRSAAQARSAQRVLYLIWREPWMTVARDTYISRMLGLFGWETWPAHATARYPTLALEDCLGEVDRVLLSSEPYPFREKHVAEVAGRLGDLPVDIIDGEMTSWYGSRAIEGLGYLERYTREASRSAVQAH